MDIILIPEDPKRDQYVLKPVFQQMYDWLGVNGYTVEMAPWKPGSVSAATDWNQLEAFIDKMKFETDFFLLCIDRDAKEARRTTDAERKPDQIDKLRDRAHQKFADEGWLDTTFFGIAAREEVEVWALGGLENLPDDWTWRDVRSDPHPKENYFEPFAEDLGVDERDANGLKALGRESASNYRTLRQKCEELERLEDRIKDWLDANWGSY